MAVRFLRERWMVTMVGKPNLIILVAKIVDISKCLQILLSFV